MGIQKFKRISENPNIYVSKENLKKRKRKKNYLDFEAGLWNTSAFRADLVERIRRSSKVSTFPKTQKLKAISLLSKPKKEQKNTQVLESIEK